jgi:hypothetical protein
MWGVAVIQNGSLDHCPYCGERFELAAVKLSMFREAAMLFVCPGCGLTHAEGPSEARLRILIAALDQRLSTLARRIALPRNPILPRPVEIEFRPAQKQRRQ